MPDVPDEKLAQGLKQALKKPRNYVLLGKGTSVLKLLVDKKPIKAGEIQEARTEYKANLVVKGIVQGDGSDLIFKVVGEEPTVKIPALRDFISEQSGLKRKPRFEVVAELAEINDTEEAESAETEGETPPAAPPAPEAATAKEGVPLDALIATMKSLAPHVQAAIQKDPGRKDALLGLVAEFQKHVKAQDAAAAKTALTALGQALKQGMTPTGGAPTGTVKIGPDFWPEWDKAKAAWLDAIDTVNGQLEKLRVELLKVPEDPELKRIAEFGLNAVTGDHKVPLQAAILEVDQARNGDPTKAIVSAKEKVTDFRDHIDTDERVEACDENPFDVKVTIRQSLDGALAQMEQALGKGLAG